MADTDVILDALTAIRDGGLCTDRRHLNSTWTELTGRRVCDLPGCALRKADRAFAVDGVR